MGVPQNIININNELEELCSKSYSIKVEDAARLMGISDDALRRSIYLGTCPFAIGIPPSKTANGFAKIPTLPFYNFMTQRMVLKYD